MKAQSWTAWNLHSTHEAIDDSIVTLHTTIGKFHITEEDDCIQVQCVDGTLLVECMSANTFRIRIKRRM
jgi:hypothetical protein